MNYNQANGAAMHKLLRIIFGVLKSQKPFDAEVDRKNQMNSKEKQKLNKEKNKLKQKKYTHIPERKFRWTNFWKKNSKNEKQMTSQIPNL